MDCIPPSIQEELERIQRDYIIGNFFNSLDELDELLERKEISLEEKLKVKLLKSELIGILAFMGLDEYAFEDGLKLAEEVVEHIEETKDKYLKVESLLILGFGHFYLNNWQKTCEIYDQYIPLFNELEPINDIYYLRMKAQNYIFESLIPFVKIYAGGALLMKKK